MQAQEDVRALLLALASLKQDMTEIKKRLDGKASYIPTEEAVKGFRASLGEKTRPNTIRSFNYLLKEFIGAFPNTNICEIPAMSIEEFLAKHWGKHPGTLRQRFSQLNWFYSWCIKYSQMKGMPAFLNPCSLIELKDKQLTARPEFIPVEKIMKFLATARKEDHWLVFAILMTSGMRVSELIGDRRAAKPGLLKRDVEGRVLTILNPKSGREKELAVIPEWVAERLHEHIKDLEPNERVISLSYSTVYDVVTTHAGWVGPKFSPHYLRKWTASFWERQGEHSMVSFVLRHSGGGLESLTSRYVATMSHEEVIEKQDGCLELNRLAELV